MAGYVKINGHPTWVHDQGGPGAPLLLLHGGMSNSDVMLGSIGAGLSERYRVIAFDRRGHGFTADTEAPFHYSDMASEAVGVLEQVVGGPAHLVGWSDGANTALLVALARPELVHKLVAIGANYHFEGVLPFDMVPEAPLAQELGSAYAARSPDGAGHLEVVLEKTFTMYASEPTLTGADLAGISHPVLVAAGDDDMVALSHTVSLYEALPAGQLAIIPGASHALPLEQPDVLTGLILRFLAAAGPPETLLPIRRAGARGA